MKRSELPVIGLINDSLLPGEEREFTAGTIDQPTRDALVASAPERVCAVAVTSPLELPALVTGRFATECTVIARSETSTTLRGERRVRIVSARGTHPLHAAEFEPAVDGAPPDASALVAGAQAVFAALEFPGASYDLDALRSALLGVVRAVATPAQIREAERWPASEVLQRLARSIAGDAPAQQAARELEASLRTLANKPSTNEALRHQLWSQVVEIQRRLDVYDPAVKVEEGDEIGRLQRRLMQSGLPRAARDLAKREIRLLRSMSSSHHDYATYLAHLDLMGRLAWHPEPVSPPDFDAVAAALDRAHAGLDRAKRRILEYLAVRALGGKASSTVLCLAGPPGTGKTTIARAMAEALGRRFVRIPLGGVHDESEIRGHRISFTAANAGRIIAGLANAGTCTPVMLLDEIDKIGTDRARSPAAALLEVLDPEQNTQFHDNYLATPYDLSNVLFLCTANDLSALAPALLDRLEIVELDGYSHAEKLSIARSHLLPKLRTEHGLPAELSITNRDLSSVIDGHTREAGVRQLTRALGALHRGRALSIVRKRETDTDVMSRAVDPDEIRDALGPARFTRESLPEVLPPGIAAGLSVGAEGGAVLFLEAQFAPGRGKLRLTGRLGDVMRESAQTALSYLRANTERYGIDPARIAGDVHVHVPDGATAKDGPSAGVGILVALVSAATGRPVRSDLVLTGEITLGGRVLPVGGVRAKLLGGERAGARVAVIPEANRFDVPTGLETTVNFAREAHEAVTIALTPEGRR